VVKDFEGAMRAAGYLPHATIPPFEDMGKPSAPVTRSQEKDQSTPSGVLTNDDVQMEEVSDDRAARERRKRSAKSNPVLRPVVEPPLPGNTTRKEQVFTVIDVDLDIPESPNLGRQPSKRNLCVISSDSEYEVELLAGPPMAGLDLSQKTFSEGMRVAPSDVPKVQGQVRGVVELPG
jgi:hypothetical protein